MIGFHILCGVIVLLSGAAAIGANKGGAIHRKAGNIFFVSMLAVSLSAICIDIQGDEIPAIGLLVAYLIITSWVTIKGREGTISVLDKLAFVLIVLISAGLMNQGWQVMRSQAKQVGSVPAEFFFVFGSMAILCGLLDLIMLLKGGVCGKHRITRHLWRMCVAFIMAVMSLLSQRSIIPEQLQGSPVLWLPIVGLISIMFFWIARVLFTNWLSKQQHIEMSGSGVRNNA